MTFEQLTIRRHDRSIRGLIHIVYHQNCRKEGLKTGLPCRPCGMASAAELGEFVRITKIRLGRKKGEFKVTSLKFSVQACLLSAAWSVPDSSEVLWGFVTFQALRCAFQIYE